MNAKNEFLEFKIDKPAIKCAKIWECHYMIDEADRKQALLNVGFTHDDFKDFVEKLDFEYDEDFGSQQLDGIIWFTDGTWASRGPEWWDYNKCPEIPKELDLSPV